MKEEENNNQDKTNLQSNPMMASVHWNFDDDKDEDLIAWFEKFKKLPLFIRYGLVDPRIQKEILNLVERYNIKTIEKTGEISRIIREYFTEQMNREVFIREAAQRTKEQLGIDSKEAITDFVKKLWGIVNLAKEVGKEEFDNEYEQLSVVEAIKKYEDTVADQMVTDNLIKGIGEDKKVAPTVKHWLEDYFERLGSEHHSSVERGRYLFESENTTSLSREEREKLSAILESFDDNKKVFILRDGGVPKIDFEITNEINGDFSKKGRENEKGVYQDNNEDEIDKKVTDSLASNRFILKEESENSNFESSKNINKEKNEKVDLSNFKQDKKPLSQKSIDSPNTLDLSEFVVDDKAG